MRICHLSDTHLGYRHFSRLSEQGINQREADVYAVFQQAIAQILELAPDAVIHSGDLFDSYHPSSRALGVALDALHALRDAGIPVIAIAGNHSTPRFSSTGHIFEVLARFGAVHALWREPQPVRIGALAIHAIPHDPDPERMTAAIAAAQPDRDAEHNVLVTHAGIEGLAHVGTEQGSVSLDPASLELAGEFDYIALGHLHTRKGVRTNACYAGSLERLTFADSAPRKGFYEIDLDQPPNAPERVREHDVTPRPASSLELADDPAAGDLAAQIIAAADGLTLDGALVRIQLAVTRDRWRTLEMGTVREHFARCLHLELQPVLAPEDPADGEDAQDIADFIAARAHDGEDAALLTERAQRLLAQADEAIAP